jgi:hypothetical protein
MDLNKDEDPEVPEALAEDEDAIGDNIDVSDLDSDHDK